VNTTTGALTSLGVVNLGSKTSDLAIMPKGNFIYAANNGSSTISGFSVNPTTGALTSVPGSPFASGSGCATDWIHPSGKFVYGENFDGSISAFSINQTTGSLTQIAGSPFSGPAYEGNSTMRGTPNGHFLANSSNQIYYDAINADGTVSGIGSVGVGTAPTSITTAGTYK
jgi:6-phosphogluconolactonase